MVAELWGWLGHPNGQSCQLCTAIRWGHLLGSAVISGLARFLGQYHWLDAVTGQRYRVDPAMAPQPDVPTGWTQCFGGATGRISLSDGPSSCAVTRQGRSLFALIWRGSRLPAQSVRSLHVLCCWAWVLATFWLGEVSICNLQLRGTKDCSTFGQGSLQAPSVGGFQAML